MQLNFLKKMLRFSRPCRLMTILSYLLGFLVVTPAAWGSLVLNVEVNPHPVEPGQAIEAQLTVTNTGPGSSGNLVLRVLWPSELSFSPVATDGGDCPGSCDAGEYLSWNLTPLGPGVTRVIGFSEHLYSSVTSGTQFDLETDLLEGGVVVAEVDHAVEVLTDSPLELFVDPLADPVPSAGQLVYELTYGNTSASASQSSELRFPIPGGTQFFAASSGGVVVGGEVVWNLGTVPANFSSRERVTLTVDPVASGTHLVVDRAVFTGIVNFQPKNSEAMAVSRVGPSDLVFSMEAHPDPVEPSQSMDVQLTITNTTASLSGNLTLRVLWPEELSFSPVATGGGDCPGSCDTGEYLFWNLGSLAPGASLALGFSESVYSGIASGRAVPLEAELLEGGLPVATLSRTTPVLADSPLEVVVDPLTDPVAVNGILTYEISYGNLSASAAEGAELRFPVPAGTQLASATGGGSPVGGEVVWSLGTVGPHSGGSVRVHLRVLPAATGGHLVVDSAKFSGTLNFQSKESRAMAVSRVGSGELEFAMEVNPDPLEPGQAVDVQLTITNTAVSVSGQLTVRALWPEELSFSPVATTGGDCPGSCDTGEYLFWNLGVLGPGASQVIAFSESLYSSVASGSLVPLEVELFDGGAHARTLSRTVPVQEDSPLELFVDPQVDPIAAGQLTYQISYGNSSASSAENTELRFPIPEGTELVSALGASVDGGEVVWDLGSLGSDTAGRKEVIVELTTPSRHLVVDSATLSGQLSFQGRRARAMAVSRVGTSDLGLTLSSDPNPISPSDTLFNQLVVTNGGGSVTGGLTLRVLWPEELSFSPTVTGGGACPGSCDTGEYLFWDLGPLGPGVEETLDFNENLYSSVGNGRIVPLEVELFEGGLPARTVSHSVLVNPFTDADNDGEADVLDPDDDNDGMPDDWETLYGLDPFNANDAGGDPDGDGLINLEEYQQGRNPLVFDLFFDGFELGNTSKWSLSIP